MKTRSVQRQIRIPKSLEDVFNALIQPSAIKKWWSASSAIIIPEKDGIYAVVWGDDEDDPDYVTNSRIMAIEKPYRLVLAYEHYISKTGKLPFEADMQVEFNLEPSEGSSILSVKQSGFPIDRVADEYLQGCEDGWERVLQSINQVLESESNPDKSV